MEAIAGSGSAPDARANPALVHISPALEPPRDLGRPAWFVAIQGNPTSHAIAVGATGIFPRVFVVECDGTRHRLASGFARTASVAFPLAGYACEVTLTIENEGGATYFRRVMGSPTRWLGAFLGYALAGPAGTALGQQARRYERTYRLKVGGIDGGAWIYTFVDRGEWRYAR